MGACSIMSLVTAKSLLLALMLILSYIIPLVNTYFIGNLNDPKLLHGVGLGNMVINVVIFGLV